MPKIAAIDVGSNAIRLLLVSFNRYGIEQKRLFTRYPLRLGADVFAHKRVLPKTQVKLISIFSDIAHRLERFKVTAYRAVGTSAMRDAQNSNKLIKFKSCW